MKLCHLNETKKQNVITIEDPIEFLYRDKRCIIAQRDLGDDTKSFATALIHALRHDPDVTAVDDEENVRRLLRSMLGNKYIVLEAKDGEIAIDIGTTKESPQTIQSEGLYVLVHTRKMYGSLKE